jgi:hypothetical protein
MFGRRIGYTIALAILAEASLGEAEATRGERAQERAAEMPDADWWEIMDTGPFISDTYRGYGPEGDIAALRESRLSSVRRRRIAFFSIRKRCAWWLGSKEG